MLIVSAHKGQSWPPRAGTSEPPFTAIPLVSDETSVISAPSATSSGSPLTSIGTRSIRIRSGFALSAAPVLLLATPAVDLLVSCAAAGAGCGPAGAAG